MIRISRCPGGHLTGVVPVTRRSVQASEFLTALGLATYPMQEPWGSRWPPNLTWMNTLPRPNAVNPDTALRAEARSRDWPVHDFRSGRRVTVIALPIVAGAGAVAGEVAAGA